MTKEERRIKVKELCEQHKSINAIAKEIGCSWDTVNRDIKSMNIKITKYVNQTTGNGISPNLFNEILDEESAYWLGFLYADGSIRTDRNEISFTLKESDKDTVEKYHKWTGNQNNIVERITKRNNKEYKSYCSSFSSAAVKQNLIKLGCVPKKSLILTFPSEHQVPRQFIHHFIRGYIDGDGYIQYDLQKHKYRIVVCGTLDFLTGIQQTLLITNNSHIRKNIEENIYTLNIEQKKIVERIMELLYNDATIFLPRKKINYDIYRAISKTN